MKIVLINNRNRLEDVLNFLKIGFNWSNEKKDKIKDYLIKENKNYKNYGYYLLDNSTIFGAFLLFEQGNIFYNNKHLKILNISSWYVAPSHRGVLPFIMLKSLVKNNKNSIITNLTATKNVQKILNSFGFKQNNTFNLRFNIIDIFIRNFIKTRKLEKIIELKQNLNNIGTRKLYSYKNLNVTNLKIDSFELSIIYSEVLREKKIFLFNIKFKIIRILWTSDHNIFSKYFFQVILFILIKKKIFFATTHCKISDRFNYLRTLDHHYILCPEYYETNGNFSGIAIGSELNII
tara:strand:+ start:3380 stop:4252 length:873 start_codon:yes stop_codon:yes gene_type:complete